MTSAPTAMSPPPTMTCQPTFSFKYTAPSRMAKTSDKRSSGITREAFPSFKARYRSNDEAAGYHAPKQKVNPAPAVELAKLAKLALESHRAPGDQHDQHGLHGQADARVHPFQSGFRQCCHDSRLSSVLP